MKVVFVEEVEGSGNVGDVKEVKNGFARNYLLPRGLVVPATKDNLLRADKLAKADQVRQDKLDGAGSIIADKIDGETVVLTARVGQQGRLFGSVTASDIAAQLYELAGQTVDHRQVLLGQSIRQIGTQEVRVRLTRNISAAVTVDVQSQDAGESEAEAEAAPTIEEAVAAVEAEEAAQDEAQAEAEAADKAADADAEKSTEN